MGTHWEQIGVDTGVDWSDPLSEIEDADTTVPAGKYALTLDGAFVIGTVEELLAYVDRVARAMGNIVHHSQAPLTIADFEPDEDGDYPCPRCEDFLGEPRSYETLHGLTQAVVDHIADAHV